MTVMKKTFTALLLSAVLPVACGKAYNSSSYDSSIYGEATGSVQFVEAKAIIKAKCATCHTRASHQAWAGMSEQEFIAQNLVRPGSLGGSTLYTQILGNRTGAPGSMPMGTSALSSTELDTLESWIQGITP